MILSFNLRPSQFIEAIAESRVYNFDHIAINDKLTACDVKLVPLPDEELYINDI